LTRAEIEYVVRTELAETVADVLERRTRVFLFEPDNGLPAAPKVARVLARLLDWDEARTQQEVSQYAAHVQHVKGFVAAPAGDDQAAHA
jgi:glycerol-3-phosphate dehydrogenase